MVESALDLGHYERGLRAQGFRLIAGVDEAGRGALAGPLVAAAVILPDGFDLEGINDSKVLTANQREVAFDRIVADAVAWSVHRCMPTRIDRRGLQRTNLSLLRRCVTGLSVPPDYVLSDGFPYDDGYESRYAEADARKSLEEVRADGVACLCLSIGGSTPVEALQRVFGSASFASAPTLAELSPRMNELFLAALRELAAPRPRERRRRASSARNG